MSIKHQIKVPAEPHKYDYLYASDGFNKKIILETDVHPTLTTRVSIIVLHKDKEVYRTRFMDMAIETYNKL